MRIFWLYERRSQSPLGMIVSKELNKCRVEMIETQFTSRESLVFFQSYKMPTEIIAEHKQCVSGLLFKFGHSLPKAHSLAAPILADL